MCIGYCHQIQCDVIMLCDNLLMITTGMEIIPLNIYIYILLIHVKYEICTYSIGTYYKQKIFGFF